MADELALGAFANPRSYLADTDELLYADMAADPSGSTGGNIAAAAIAHINASGDWIFPTGDVGIGTSSPVSRIHINTPGALASYAVIGNSNGGTVIGVDSTGSSKLSGYAGREIIFGSYNFGGSFLENARFDASGHFRCGGDNTFSIGTSSFRWSTIFAATGTINTSDERFKDEISEIPEVWLDAWSLVEWCKFKFKGGNRWHIGLVAQRVHAAFESCGIDAFEIGLCCYDKWEQETSAIFDAEGNDTGKVEITLEAGDRWGLRYDECQAIEVAWQRREISRMAERLAKLEAA